MSVVTTRRMRVEVGGHRAEVGHQDDSVRAYVDDYMDGFWRVAASRRGDDDDAHRIPGDTINAVRDEAAFTQLLADASTGADTVVFMRAPARVCENRRRRTVVCVTPPVAFTRRLSSHDEAERVDIVAGDRSVLGMSAMRTIRDLLSARLESDGFVMVHAAAAMLGDHCVLALGGKGAGKTSTALSLVAHAGWSALANDRAYVRVAEGVVEVLPWPSSLNIGLGLVAALGWLAPLVERYRGGQQPPYRQSEGVTRRLRAASGDASWVSGREEKVQLLPRHLREWLGVSLARTARLSAVLLPTVDVSTTTARVGGRSSGWPGSEHLVPAPGAPDYYPDFLGFRAVDGDQRTTRGVAVLHEVARLVPGIRVHLGADTARNAEMLASVIVAG